ncbi:class I SAM-dependent methyltransferase [Flindersiella endophytica]
MAIRRPAAAERLVWAVATLRLQPSDRLLEIGCGHGVAVTLACDRLTAGGTVLALDRSAKMIEQARRRNAEHIASGRASFQITSLEHANLAGAQFDKVLGVHVPVFARGDPACELAVIRDHLAPGGAVYLSYQPLDPADTEPTIARLEAVLKQNGFTAADVQTADLSSGRALTVVGTPAR